MRTTRNSNHPPKGAIIKAEPIVDPHRITAIERYLDSKPRDLSLFVVGVNTNLRASDLRRLTVGNVQGLRLGRCDAAREEDAKSSSDLSQSQSHRHAGTLAGGSSVARAARCAPVPQSAHRASPAGVDYQPDGEGVVPGCRAGGSLFSAYVAQNFWLYASGGAWDGVRGHRPSVQSQFI